MFAGLDARIKREHKLLEQIISDKSQVITYLRSTPTDTTSLGRATHSARQAAGLWELWYSAFPDDVRSYRCQYSPLFSGEYPPPDDEATWSFTEKALREDRERLEALGLTLNSGDERAAWYRCKLHRTLYRCKDELATAAEAAAFGYEAHEGAATDGLQYLALQVIVQGRQRSTRLEPFFRLIYELMLEAAIPALLAQGYPDGEARPWVYDGE